MGSGWWAVGRACSPEIYFVQQVQEVRSTTLSPGRLLCRVQTKPLGCLALTPKIGPYAPGRLFETILMKEPGAEVRRNGELDACADH